LSSFAAESVGSGPQRAGSDAFKRERSTYEADHPTRVSSARAPCPPQKRPNDLPKGPNDLLAGRPPCNPAPDTPDRDPAAPPLPTAQHPLPPRTPQGKLQEVLEKGTPATKLREALRVHRNLLFQVMYKMGEEGRKAGGILLPHIFVDALRGACDECDGAGVLENDVIRDFCSSLQEIVVVRATVAFAVRPRVGRWYFLSCDVDVMDARDLSAEEFLLLKERLVKWGDSADGGEALRSDPFTLEVDMDPFDSEFPRMHRSSWIGQGVNYLNRYLSSKLFQSPERSSAREADAAGPGGSGFTLLYRFMRGLKYRDEQARPHQPPPRPAPPRAAPRRTKPPQAAPSRPKPLPAAEAWRRPRPTGR